MPRALTRTAFIFLTADQCLISVFMTRRVNVCRSRVFCSVWKSVSQAWLYFLHASLIILSKEQWHCVVLLLQLWAPCRIKITLFSRIETLNMQEKIWGCSWTAEETPRATLKALGPGLVLMPLQRQVAPCPSDSMAVLKHFIVQALELTSSGERSTHLSPSP